MSTTPTPDRSRGKRVRKSYACILCRCREKKIRCDRQRPCTPCVTEGLDHFCAFQDQRHITSATARERTTGSSDFVFLEDDAGTRTLIEMLQTQMSGIEETIADRLRPSSIRQNDQPQQQ